MAWRDRAACVGLDPNIFFPERGQSNDEALEVCARCPVREECLQAGLYEREGVWGGLSGRQRRTLRASLGLVKCVRCGCGKERGGSRMCSRCERDVESDRAQREAAAKLRSYTPTRLCVVCGKGLVGVSTPECQNWKCRKIAQLRRIA